MAEHFRQGMRSPALEVKVFTQAAFVDFTGWTSLAFRMVGAGVVVAGAASASAGGTLIYSWSSSDLAVAGTYAAVFTGIDPNGLPATFPTGANLEIVVVPGI